ncbi:MAG: PspC domain-containing protein [Acidobacteriaceae bacterium]|nr:PspC domain-containing protein [Acidobacteriaceae bacterium]MBV8572032.1 PspC domain-containing protein [Acidobacteriaceae bacterium]
MYCVNCGTELADSFRYCPGCGTATGTQSPGSEVVLRRTRLTRSRTDRKIAGVCAGLARYIGMDVTLLRVLFVVFTIWPCGAGLLAYIICWIVVPNEALLLPPAGNANPNLVKA